MTHDPSAPVAWMVYTLDGKSVCVTDNPSDFTDNHKALPLYITPLPEQDRTQWLISNSANWSWNPARYNAEKISGFVYKGTGYLGYTFEDAVDLAMRFTPTHNQRH